jgi:predicted polyphosphate/ATP-dependent NAD kinase
VTIASRREYASATEVAVARVREQLDAGAELVRAEVREVLDMDERKFRAAVSDLRRHGYPVISSSEQGSTYRKAHSPEELEAFIARELRPRALDLLEQEHQLREHASDHFEPRQLQLGATGDRA